MRKIEDSIKNIYLNDLEAKSYKSQLTRKNKKEIINHHDYPKILDKFCQIISVFLKETRRLMIIIITILLTAGTKYIIDKIVKHNNYMLHHAHENEDVKHLISLKNQALQFSIIVTYITCSLIIIYLSILIMHQLITDSSSYKIQSSIIYKGFEFILLKPAKKLCSHSIINNHCQNIQAQVLNCLNNKMYDVKHSQAFIQYQLVNCIEYNESKKQLKITFKDIDNLDYFKTFKDLAISHLTKQSQVTLQALVNDLEDQSLDIIKAKELIKNELTQTKIKKYIQFIDEQENQYNQAQNQYESALKSQNNFQSQFK